MAGDTRKDIERHIVEGLYRALRDTALMFLTAIITIWVASYTPNGITITVYTGACVTVLTHRRWKDFINSLQI